MAFAAASTPDGVRLTWLRPLRYSGGQRMNDLDRFLIDRALAADTPRFDRIGERQLDDRFRFRRERHMEWVDTSAEAGKCYAYRAFSVTRDGSRSRAAGPVSICYEPKGAK